MAARAITTSPDDPRPTVSYVRSTQQNARKQAKKQLAAEGKENTAKKEKKEPTDEERSKWY